MDATKCRSCRTLTGWVIPRAGPGGIRLALLELMAKKNPPDLYKYYSAQKFVQDFFSWKKSHNPSYSIRAWATALGLKSHTPLHAIVTGTKKAPLSIYAPLKRSLGLDDEQSHFLLLMINIEQTQDQYSRSMLLDQLELLKQQKNFRMKDLADFRLLSDPFWGQLLEMTELNGFRADPFWIKEHSRIQKSVGEIKSTIHSLIEKGLLQVQDGRLKKTHQSITNVPDLANLGSRKYHRNVSALASEQVEVQSVDEREMNGYALNIHQYNVGKMKQSVRKFVKQFLSEFEAAPGEGDATYQFNAQFFSLTRKS